MVMSGRLLRGSRARSSCRKIAARMRVRHAAKRSVNVAKPEETSEVACKIRLDPFGIAHDGLTGEGSAVFHERRRRRRLGSRKRKSFVPAP